MHPINKFTVSPFVPNNDNTFSSANYSTGKLKNLLSIHHRMRPSSATRRHNNCSASYTTNLNEINIWMTHYEHIKLIFSYLSSPSLFPFLFVSQSTEGTRNGGAREDNNVTFLITTTFFLYSIPCSSRKLWCIAEHIRFVKNVNMAECAGLIRKKMRLRHTYLRIRTTCLITN